VVVTPGGCTREYFGDEAEYAEAGDAASIRAAVERALAASPRPALAERVARDYTWDAAAAATLRGYEIALGGGGSP
jgi:glycosyltransferase involved in cell wall biosynthesis